MINLAAGPYSVVLADPPWRFRKWSDTNDAKSARRHYDLMTLDEICALPVRDIVADNAALFIWATWPTIFQTQQVIEAWGFKYSGLAWEWIKQNPKTGKYSFGTGYGTRKNLEPCLLARRGQPKLKSKSVRDFMFAARREHSRKPDAQYERIEQMYDGRYMEIFARQVWPGWSQYGDQVGLLEPGRIAPPPPVTGPLLDMMMIEPIPLRGDSSAL